MLVRWDSLTVGIDDDQLVLDSVVGFGTSDSLEHESKGRNELTCHDNITSEDKI